MRRGGVGTVAGYLVPWLAEGGGEDTPGEVVQRCIVFLGVLVQHVLPGGLPGSHPGGPGGGGGEQLGRALAAEAEATLEETIGVEATREILIAAEELDDTPEPHEGYPLDDSSSEGGSFGTYGSSKSGDTAAAGRVREHQHQHEHGREQAHEHEHEQAHEQERGGAGHQGQARGGYRARTEREVGEELLAGSLAAMRVSGVDMSQVDDILAQAAQQPQQGQERN